MQEGEQLTTLEYALLGLLSFVPSSGYDVHRLFTTTPLGHFSSSPGAIYPALRRLERRGLLRAALDRSRETRPRRVYSIAPAGEAALEMWVRQQVTREELIRQYGVPILRFAMARGRLAREEVLAYLRGWRQVLVGYLEEVRGHRAAMEAQAGTPMHALLALEHGLRSFECERRWIDHALARIAGEGRRNPPGRRARRKTTETGRSQR